MGKSAWVISRFDGGQAVDAQLGAENSFAYSRHVDFRKKPSQMTTLPATREDSSGVVRDLVQNAVMANDGTTYWLGDSGFFYRRTTAGVWSTRGKLDNGAFGLSYRSDVDKIFACSTKTVSEFSPVSSNPVFKLSKYGASASTDSNAVSTGGMKTTTLDTSFNEGSTSRQDFASDVEPLNKIQVFIPAKGTGNWTLTLHDAANNVLATSTVSNANLINNQWNDFAFSSQIRLYVKPNARTYHFHLTSTVADGRVQCATAGDLNTCDFKIWADRLIATKNGMHPMQTFLQYECIGNGNYLSVWEPLSEEPSNGEWLRHKLTFPSNLEVCGLAVWREYLAIACEHKTDSGSPQQGYIFFWDGLSSTYNFFIRVPEGSPYSLHEYKDVLYYEAGGAYFAYAGGQPVKIRTMPNTDSEYSDTTDTTITYPNMATVRRGVHILGFPSTTTNTSIEYGGYSFGAVDKDFRDSFGYSYTISTSTRTNASGNLKIGMIKNFGDTMFMSWQDGTTVTYGVDIVDNSSDPFDEAEWHSVFFDGEIPTKDKLALYIDIGFESLPNGATIMPKYRTSRSGSWTEGTETTSGTSLRMPVNKRFKEIQVGFDLAATTATPTVTAVVLVFDDLSTEKLA